LTKSNYKTSRNASIHSISLDSIDSRRFQSRHIGKSCSVIFRLTFRNRPPHSIKRGVGLLLLPFYFFFTHFPSGFTVTLSYFYFILFILRWVVEPYNASFWLFVLEEILRHKVARTNSLVSSGYPARGLSETSYAKHLFKEEYLFSFWNGEKDVAALFPCCR